MQKHISTVFAVVAICVIQTSAKPLGDDSKNETFTITHEGPSPSISIGLGGKLILAHVETVVTSHKTYDFIDGDLNFAPQGEAQESSNEESHSVLDDFLDAVRIGVTMDSFDEDGNVTVEDEENVTVEDEEHEDVTVEDTLDSGDDEEEYGRRGNPDDSQDMVVKRECNHEYELCY